MPEYIKIFYVILKRDLTLTFREKTDERND